jgi:hypothetical protein
MLQRAIPAGDYKIISIQVSWKVLFVTRAVL